MRNRKLLTLVAFAALTACATGPVAITYDEASAFERSLLAQETVAPKRPELLFVQPVNKSEDCKLPTSQDQLNRPNFRAFWDGGCKDGFAFGLGRDIAISDTHHVEEITIHDGTGDNWSQPAVTFDFVNSMVAYGIGGKEFPERTVLLEKMDNSLSGFNALQTLSVVDKLGNSYVVQSSAFNPERVFFLSENNGAIIYKFTDLSAAPAISPDALVFSTELVDPRTNKSGGVGGAVFANGTAKHYKFVDGKIEQTSLPSAYTDHLIGKFEKIWAATSNVGVTLQSAGQIEREYLYKACNGEREIEGMDNATYSKICTWRDQFKEPYAEASANYQQQLQTMRQQAATAEQQRQIQQLIVLQQQLVQQQRSQQTRSELNQSTQQILEGVRSRPAPQVAPLLPPGGDKVICSTIGSITTCR